jgi:hypothetical protein
MFVNAIEEVAKYTRAIHFVTREFESSTCIPGTATLFFVNEMGVAVTCRHVTGFLGHIINLNKQFEQYKTEKINIPKSAEYDARLQELQQKFHYKPGVTIEGLMNLVLVTGEPTYTFRWVNHPDYDIAILFMENFSRPLYTSHAYFAKDTSGLQQGKFLCRLGFPFPEFTNFHYNQDNDRLEWTNTGAVQTPRFPIEGMLTRHLLDNNKIVGVELSTPGLRGQSGGPVFDKDGLVYGMQSSTTHLHLGFDMTNQEIVSGAKKIQVNNQPFLHVGRCVHVNAIKDFLRQHDVKFYEK